MTVLHSNSAAHYSRSCPHSSFITVPFPYITLPAEYSYHVTEHRNYVSVTDGDTLVLTCLAENGD